MKNVYKIIGLITVVLAIVYLISSTVNLILNKKYAVDEIKYIERKQGLEGAQEIITEDYINAINSNLFIVFVLIAFTVIILIQMKRNK